MKDAFIGVMCLLLLVDLYGRLRDVDADTKTYWVSLSFNAGLLGWGITSILMGVQ